VQRTRSLLRTMVLAALPLVLAPPAGRAEVILSTPIVTSINGTLTYNAATGNFHSDSQAIVIASPSYPGGFAAFVTPGQVTIDLFVDKSGHFVNNGIGFQMSGSVDFDHDGKADATGTLLTGTITSFQSQAPGPPTRTFEGLFTITGGALTQDVMFSGGGSVFGGYPVGFTGGFILDAENVSKGILGDFSADFSSTSIKDQEGLVVPEPSSWALALLGSAELGILDFIRRRTRRRRVPSWVTGGGGPVAATDPPEGFPAS
jgi:hypothetical protein